MHHIPAHTKLKVTLILFFSNIFCPKLPQARALHLIFSCVLFYILFVLVFCDLFVRNCLGLERQTCFSPQALEALAPPKPGFGSHGSCLRQPANPWTCQQNAKSAPIWFVCQFRSAVASALGGRPVFFLSPKIWVPGVLSQPTWESSFQNHRLYTICFCPSWSGMRRKNIFTVILYREDLVSWGNWSQTSIAGGITVASYISRSFSSILHTTRSFDYRTLVKWNWQ